MIKLIVAVFPSPIPSVVLCQAGNGPIEWNYDHGTFTTDLYKITKFIVLAASVLSIGTRLLLKNLVW